MSAKSSEQSQKSDAILVMVTCGGLYKGPREAQKIAKTLVEERLAACVNLLRFQLQSLYRWEGKLKKDREILLLIKTTETKFPAVEKRIRELHSYENPEIIAIPIVAGSAAYLQWLKDSVE